MNQNSDTRRVAKDIMQSIKVEKQDLPKLERTQQFNFTFLTD
jgi:hypothetical protein